MAEPDVETDPNIAANTTQLEKKLLRLVNVFFFEDDYSTKDLQDAMDVLSCLMELKIKNLVSLKLDESSTSDPAFVATGLGSDKEVVTDERGFFNLLIEGADEEVVTDADRVYFNALLEKVSPSLLCQKEAAKELRQLTKKKPSIQVESTNISRLVNPLSLGKADSHPDLQEDLITTIFNLSSHPQNKRLVAESPMVIPLLVESLKKGTIETRTNAVAALKALSSLDSNKLIIGNSGALKPLVDLLEEGQQFVRNDVTSVIHKLLTIDQNMGKAVSAGAVRVILKNIADGISQNASLCILGILSIHPSGRMEMGALGAVHCLFTVMKESTSQRNKENSVAILDMICSKDPTKWKQIKDKESTSGALFILAESGTSRAKMKARSILEMLKALN